MALVVAQTPETVAATKRRVWRYWQAMDAASSGDVTPHLHPDVVWHGSEPFRRLRGSAEIEARFWQPLRHALPDLVRRPTVFLGGRFEGGNWVCGTGDFIGTFAQDWLLGNHLLPATGSTVHFRFGEFCRVEAGRIAEIRLIIDLPDLARQAGRPLLPASYGRDLWIPGPISGDGVLWEGADSAESAQTLQLIEAMIFGGLNRYDGKDQNSQGLEAYWHPDMVWHGPVGMGSAYGIDEFKRHAQGPVVRAFPDRKGIGHQARIAEGVYAASTGWPSLAGTHVQPYLDWPATGERIGWNIMDFWRRDGDLLRENWVMVDMVGAALASGVDLLRKLPRTGTHQ